MNPLQCNLLIVGKTGAGKSSFCNYIFDKPDFFKTGKGKPVTGWEQNFQSYHFDAAGMPIQVYDTVGLEVNNYEEWIIRLRDFLSKHSVNEEDPSKWIHGVFYVINACSDRVEDLEKRLIKETFVKQAGLPVQIILTNCDNAKDQQKQAITKELKAISEDLSIHEVNSVSQRFRNKSTEAFGRELVLETFLSQSYQYIGKRMALKTIEELKTFFLDTKIMVKRNIDQSDISIFNINKLEELDVDTLLPSNEKVEGFMESLASYGDFMDSFDIKYQGKNELENLMEKLGSSMDGLSSSVMNDLEKAFENVEHGDFFERISGFFTVAGAVLDLKGTLKRIMDDAFNYVLSQLDQARADILDDSLQNILNDFSLSMLKW